MMCATGCSPSLLLYFARQELVMRFNWKVTRSLVMSVKASLFNMCIPRYLLLFDEMIPLAPLYPKFYRSSLRQLHPS